MRPARTGLKSSPPRIGDLGPLAAFVREQEWGTTLKSPPETLRHQVAGTLKGTALLQDLQGLKVDPTCIIAILAGGLYAITRFQELRSRRRKIAVRWVEGRAKEIEEGLDVHLNFGKELRRLGRARRRAKSDDERARLDSEIQNVRASLKTQTTINNRIRGFLLGRGKPERVYLKLCARALVDYFRSATGRPRHGLAGTLMLASGVFPDGSGFCRPWDPLTEARRRCRNWPGRRRCSKSRCRRAEDYVKQLVAR